MESEVHAQPDYIMDSEEMTISDIPDLPEPVALQTQQVPDPPQTVSPKIIEPEWVKKLELHRIQAETKMAAAALMNAEAVKNMAKVSLMDAKTHRMNAKTNRMNAETNRMNAETNRLIAETNHKQLELMKANRNVVGQPRSAGLRPTNSLQNKTRITMFCPKCDTKISHTTVLKALQETEPSENRGRACKRSRQTDRSSSEVDSSDDTDDVILPSSVQSEIDLAVNEEPSYIEVTKKQARTDPLSVRVKTEPMDDEANDVEPVHEESSNTEVTEEQARTDPNSVHVKTKPQDGEANDVEPEIDVGPAAVNEVPSYIEVIKVLARTDPSSLDVKTEPQDDEANEYPLRDRRDLGNPRKAKDHMPNRMEKYQRCKQCAIDKERKSTRYKCNACNVYLCAAPCFLKYHSV